MLEIREDSLEKCTTECDNESKLLHRTWFNRSGTQKNHDCKERCKLLKEAKEAKEEYVLFWNKYRRELSKIDLRYECYQFVRESVIDFVEENIKNRFSGFTSIKDGLMLLAQDFRLNDLHYDINPVFENIIKHSGIRKTRNFYKQIKIIYYYLFTKMLDIVDLYKDIVRGPSYLRISPYEYMESLKIKDPEYFEIKYKLFKEIFQDLSDNSPIREYFYDSNRKYGNNSQNREYFYDSNREDGIELQSLNTKGGKRRRRSKKSTKKPFKRFKMF